MRIASLPLANLDSTVVFLLGGHHQPAFCNGIGDGFFHIHILSGLTGFYGNQAMPVVGGTDDHCINILIVQQFSVIAILQPVSW